MQIVAFIHIPKTAGNSFMKAFSLLNTSVNFKRLSTANGIDAQSWQDAYSFCVVRNPYDRAVSSYYFHVKTDYQGQLMSRYPKLKSYTFEQYLELRTKYNEFLLMPQVNFISRRDGLADVKKILRFESLQQGIEQINQDLNVKLELEHLNSSPRPKNYQSFYNETTFKLVSDIYAKDIEAFNYEF
ncbi:sulfotransferase family 2 domain-containing protein [Aliiglaciecola litoralis]|uniref:Sulfotransferase family protein n=1 Tax=Aliiglaciecola litoralis TaxID=582857 RepID=A0ABP3WYX6_9ALTE